MAAQFTQPSSDLKQKVGDSSAEENQLATAALSDALQKLAPESMDHIVTDIAALQSIEAPFDADKLADIYGRAHAIRGLAGSVSKPELSELTDNLCRYIKANPGLESIDQRLIIAHLGAISLCAQFAQIDQATYFPLITALRDATANNHTYTKQ